LDVVFIQPLLSNGFKVSGWQPWRMNWCIVIAWSMRCCQQCEWILAAWCLVPPEIVEMGFKVTGISNEMDNSEDFMISDIDKGSGWWQYQ
jgi:hypothetical protein